MAGWRRRAFDPSADFALTLGIASRSQSPATVFLTRAWVNESPAPGSILGWQQHAANMASMQT